jgi:hypothetical protein
MPTPGILLVRVRIASPELSEEDFNSWYNQEHVTDALAAGFGDLALRYKNLDPKATWPYCTVYQTSDLEASTSPEASAKVPATSDLLPGKGAWRELIEIQRLPFELIQRFEGQSPYTGRGDEVLEALFEPADETEFDDWYRKQVSEVHQT